MTVKHIKVPCAACPFSRNVEPGALGGSPAATYIGQSEGPFVLPCHKACDFDDPDWKVKAIDTPQCAGAAIYRANIGVADRMPDAIHKLPADTETVFASHAEFLAHHTRMSVENAEAVLHGDMPMFFLVRELQRAGLITYLPKPPEKG